MRSQSRHVTLSAITSPQLAVMLHIKVEQLHIGAKAKVLTAKIVQSQTKY